mgnify:CR=1 FL=1
MDPQLQTVLRLYGEAEAAPDAGGARAGIASAAVHFVIMGCGRVGSTLAHILEAQEHSVAVVDRNTGNITGELSSETQVTIDGAPQTIRTFRTTAILTDTLLQDLRANVEQVGNDRVAPCLDGSSRWRSV